MNKFITYLLLLIGWFSSKLSFKSRKRFGEFVGDILRILSKKREQITYDNLKYAFPNQSEVWINNVVKKSYHNLGIVLVETPALKYFSKDYMSKYLKVENIGFIDEVLQRGKGLILMSGHYGNWELMAYGVGLLANIPILIVVKPQQNDFLDKFLNEFRTMKTNSVVPMSKAARKMVSTIKNGKSVALLVDQSADKNKDIYVDFFGRPAATYEAPAVLSLKFKTPIVYAFVVRNEDGTYKLKLSELKTDDLENTKENIRILTERHVKALEDAIREHPYLWTWQHRRWKHQP